MSTTLVIEIKVVDQSTGKVETHLIETYDGSYGWEVERLFAQLGDKVAKTIDPGYDG